MSLPSSSSFILPTKEYDVFLSFRGTNTRKTFTDHLYHALERSGIVTFRDDPRLKTGKEITPELLKAIQQSQCFVIILSENYASSSWCLEELAEIVKLKEQEGLEVFPIFYHVDPSYFRRHKGKVGDDFAKHEKRCEEEDKHKIQKWRDALTQVTNISGKHLKNDEHEGKFIGAIVKEISAKLCKKYPIVHDGLVGISSRLKELNSKIQAGEDDVRIVGIWGMGCIRKTTLARVFYDRMSPDFEGKSFIADVREVSNKDGLVSLQKQLLSQILNEEGFNLFNVHDGKNIISRRLSCKKVLIVLDDVDNLQQLECLVGRRDWFGSGSRIIVTTRDEHLLQRHRADDVYKPTTLNGDDALRLFNSNAFGNNMMPNDDFMELSKRVVRYAGGLPLALKVLGSFLCSRDAALWTSAIKRLERDPDEDIIKVLKISFDGLKETEKNIFLDIACFFNGWKKYFVMNVLDGCEFSAGIGIDVLVKKSLVTVDKYNRLGMHDLLKEMGRMIVREKSIKEPGKRCRLWDSRDVHHVLTQNTATDKIECLVTGHDQRVSNEMLHLNGNAFSKMVNLRLLRVICSTNCDHLDFLPNGLRLLDWDFFPLESLPSSFRPNNLVALLLRFSRIKQFWKGTLRIDKLKEIDLTQSRNLTETPDLRMAPNVEVLNFYGCTSLVDVHPSIGELKSLKLLNLRGCKSLRSLPPITGMISLEKLDLTHCSNLEGFPEIDGKMERLLKLNLNGTGIKELPDSIGNLNRLVSLDLGRCHNLIGLPKGVGECKSLETLDLYGCTELKDVDPSIGELKRVKFLDLRGCSSLRSLPPITGMISLEKLTLVALLLPSSRIKQLWKGTLRMDKLKEIDISRSTNLTETPDLRIAPNVEVLNFVGCTNLVHVHPSIGELKSVKLLNLSGCESLRSLPPITGMISLEKLTLSSCSNLKGFPEIDGKMERLLELNLYRSGIKELPSGVGGCKNLEKIDLGYCTRLEEVHPSIGLLKRVKHLNLKCCRSLKSLPTKIGMESLETLRLSSCSKLERFPEIDGKMERLLKLNLDRSGIKELPSGIGGCKNLEKIGLPYCTRLEEVHPSIGLLKRVKHLNLIGCTSLKSFPTKIAMESLETFTLSSCSELERFPEIDGKMERLLKINLNGTGIKELPDSIGNLNRLVSLDLKGCHNLLGLPKGVGECKRLKTLDLYGCCKIENLPENLQQAELLEELDLRETAITTSPSFIFQFKNLKILSFKGCKGPSQNLASLSLGMTNSMALMLQSFSCLSSLTSLILRYCNLGEGDIPTDIGCLSSLEILDLSGNHFISIPSSITRLSKLYSVDLSDCKKLKSLHDLLTTVARLKTDGCDSLERIADPSKACSNSTEPASFTAVNCYRLVENMNAETWLKKHLKVFAKSRKPFHIIMPGSEIPEWFSTHERVESSSMTIKILRTLTTRNDSQWMGVVFSGIFVNRGDLRWRDGKRLFQADVGYRNSGPDGRNCIISQMIGPVEKDHIFLLYLPRHELTNACQQERDKYFGLKNKKLEWDEFQLEFGSDVEVKRCGVQMVYQEDLEDIQLIKEQQYNNQGSAEIEDNNKDRSTANGSHVKRKRNVSEEDTEVEPQPKRPE